MSMQAHEPQLCAACSARLPYTAANIAIRSDERIVCNGVDVGFTTTEFAVAALLIRGHERWVRYQEIYAIIRSPTCRNPHFGNNVRSMVKRIRRKFEAVDPGFDRIKTYPKYGYRWFNT